MRNLGSGSWPALAIVLRRKLAAPIARATDFGPAVMEPDVQSATLGLHTVIHVPNYMDHYIICRPLRDGRRSWPCWLTDSGRLNHKMVTHPASSLAQDRESSPAETSVRESEHGSNPMGVVMAHFKHVGRAVTVWHWHVVKDCQYFFTAVLPSVLVLRKADKLALRYQCLENAFCTYCRSI